MERQGVEAKHERIKSSRLADIAERERKAVDEIRAEFEKARQIETPAKGISRIVQAVIRQAGKIDVDRHQRDMERQQQAEQKIGDLRSQFNAERAALQEGQKREIDQIKERHATEDRQLAEVFQSRADRDRIAEVHDRQREAQERVNDRRQEHTHERERKP